MLSLIYFTETNFFLGTSIFLWGKAKPGRMLLLLFRVSLAWAGLFTKWKTGRFLLLVSLFLYFGEYLGMRLLKKPRKINEVKAMFLMAHISLISFLFDLPGWFVGQRASIIVVSLNVFALLYVVGSAIFKLDYHAGWGCYGSGASLKELDGGLCMGAKAFIDGNFDTNHYPAHCVKGYEGNLEAFSLCDHPLPFSFSKTLHVVAHLLSLSAGIYFGKIPTKFERLVQNYNKKHDKL